MATGLPAICYLAREVMHAIVVVSHKGDFSYCGLSIIIIPPMAFHLITVIVVIIIVVSFTCLLRSTGTDHLQLRTTFTSTKSRILSLGHPYSLIGVDFELKSRLGE